MYDYALVTSVTGETAASTSAAMAETDASNSTSDSSVGLFADETFEFVMI